MIKLRPYQNIVSDTIYTEFYKKKNRQSLCVVAPTGGGKTVIFCDAVRRLVEDGKKYMVMANRQELIYQPQEKLLKLAVDMEAPALRPNIIMGNTAQFNNRAGYIASVQTLQNRSLPDVDIIIVDEAHLSASAKWEEMLMLYKELGVFIVGFTATPERLDGKPLSGIYDRLVECGSVKQLTMDRFLVPVRYKYKTVDVSMLKMKGKDYDEKVMFAKIYKQGAIHDNIVDDYFEYANGLKTLVFCCNIEHATQLAQEFLERGLVARSLTSKDSNSYRRQLLKSFAEGHIDVLTNCGVLTTGYDCPSVQCVLLARATKSLVLYLQMIGRGTRPSENKEHLVVLDYGNNVAEFGRIDIDRNWSLEGRKKKKVIASKLCPNVVDEIPCMQVCEVDAKTCDVCGYVFDGSILGLADIDKLISVKREIKVVQGGVMIEEDDPLYKMLQETKLKDVPTELLDSAVEIKGYKKGAAFMERKRREELTDKEKLTEVVKRYCNEKKVPQNVAYSHIYRLIREEFKLNVYQIVGQAPSVLGRIEESDATKGTNYLAMITEYIEKNLLKQTDNGTK